MAQPSQLSVLTLNCWGLKFVSKERESRLRLIGQYLSDASRGYDIVGLQEVWVYDDFLRIQQLVQATLPYAKHWYSGVLGSGLVVLSKYPIVSTTMRRFALNGDPFKVTHGDWFVGKCVVSAVIAHPTCGEIEVFNTHLHAGYDPVGTPDSYLGCRVGEAWEMAGLLKAATTQGRHVISLGDYNSAPNSLVVDLITRQGGLTDSWKQLHPEPLPVPSGLTPEEGVSIMGVTCDTPLNTWTKHFWNNYWTKDPIGERLDYIFYAETPELTCNRVEVTLREQIPGVGKPGSGNKNYSDHFGVHATFAISPAVYHFQNRVTLSPSSSSSSNTPGAGLAVVETNSSTTRIGSEGGSTKGSSSSELPVEKLEQILLVLKQHREKMDKKTKFQLTVATPLGLIATLGLCIGYLWIQPRWVAFILSFVLSALSAFWIVHFLYGFLFNGESFSAFTNIIEEVQTVLDRRLRAEQRHQDGLSGVTTTTRSSLGGGGGLLRK